jgi:hypothetical protein
MGAPQLGHLPVDVPAALAFGPAAPRPVHSSLNAAHHSIAALMTKFPLMVRDVDPPGHVINTIAWFFFPSHPPPVRPFVPVIVSSACPPGLGFAGGPNPGPGHGGKLTLAASSIEV